MSQDQPAALSPAEALSRLRHEHGCAVSYRQLWAALVGAEIPGRRGANGRNWLLDPADLPHIAALFRARRAA